MSLPFASLRQISSISLAFAPLSTSQASRSMRLLLARIPARGPAGIDLPELKTTTVHNEADQKILVTYKNKQTVTLDMKASSVRILDLIRKIEAPARALRLKEEGL